MAGDAKDKDKDKDKDKLRKKRKGLYRFRAVVRLVILNRQWLEEVEDETLGSNVTRNIALITRRKGKKGLISKAEKGLLQKNPDDRTTAERRRLVTAISSLQCFARYPPRVRGLLARVCFYLFYVAGKVIVKEGHRADAMYFILDGEIIVTKNVIDPATNKPVERQVGLMGPGDMFGEVALLNKTARTATCTSGTNVELLCIYSTDFDSVLRDTLQAQWNQIILAVERFDIFNDWTEVQKRECCILAKIKEYDPLQIIYFEDKGLLNFVYFVLSGQCSILQCLRVQAKVKPIGKSYTLSSLALAKSESHEIIEKLNAAADEIVLRHQSKEWKAKKEGDVEDDGAMETEQSKELKLYSLDDLHNSPEATAPTEPTDIQQFFQKDIDESKEDPTKMEYHFIDVGTLTCGAIFGLGEPMEHRMIMAKTQVQCLLIPRFWLLQKTQNASNIWRRTQMYLEATIPSREELFKDFQANRKWRKYKKSLMAKLATQCPDINNTKEEDIPIVCRIVEATD